MQSENVAVRRALLAKGLKPLRVKHGRGTARGWLHVTVQGPDAFLLPCECPEWAVQKLNSHVAPCPKLAAQEEARRLSSLARTAIHEATGRDSSKDDAQSDYNESNYLIFVKPEA